MGLIPWGRSGREREVELASRLDKYIELASRWHRHFNEVSGVSQARYDKILALSAEIDALSSRLSKTENDLELAQATLRFAIEMNSFTARSIAPYARLEAK